jgi:hypothetical protein
MVAAPSQVPVQSIKLDGWKVAIDGRLVGKGWNTAHDNVEYGTHIPAGYDELCASNPFKPSIHSCASYTFGT